MELDGSSVSCNCSGVLCNHQLFKLANVSASCCSLLQGITNWCEIPMLANVNDCVAQSTPLQCHHEHANRDPTLSFVRIYVIISSSCSCCADVFSNLFKRRTTKKPYKYVCVSIALRNITTQGHMCVMWLCYDLTCVLPLGQSSLLLTHDQLTLRPHPLL